MYCIHLEKSGHFADHHADRSWERKVTAVAVEEDWLGLQGGGYSTRLCEALAPYAAPPGFLFRVVPQNCCNPIIVSGITKPDIAQRL